jgi:hypothetical protein
MNIYLLSQTELVGYDTYDSCVVLAETEEEARTIHPNSNFKYRDDLSRWVRDSWYDKYLKENIIPYFDSSWCKHPEAVIVKYLGEFKGNLDDYPTRIICSSFNAG